MENGGHFVSASMCYGCMILFSSSDSIEEFLQTEEEKLTLLPCNGYLRKLIFQSMTQRLVAWHDLITVEFFLTYPIFSQILMVSFVGSKLDCITLFSASVHCVSCYVRSSLFNLEAKLYRQTCLLFVTRFRGSIHLDSQTTNQGNQRWRQIVVTRVTGEDDFQRREEAKRAAEMVGEWIASIGFLRWKEKYSFIVLI